MPDHSLSESSPVYEKPELGRDRPPRHNIDTKRSEIKKKTNKQTEAYTRSGRSISFYLSRPYVWMIEWNRHDIWFAVSIFSVGLNLIESWFFFNVFVLIVIIIIYYKLIRRYTVAIFIFKYIYVLTYVRTRDPQHSFKNRTGLTDSTGNQLLFRSNF